MHSINRFCEFPQLIVMNVAFELLKGILILKTKGL